MMPIFAKFVAKRRHRNALHVTFICAQIACASIIVILMSLSKPLIDFNMSHGCLMWQVYNVLCHRGHLSGTTTQFGNMQ